MFLTCGSSQIKQAKSKTLDSFGFQPKVIKRVIKPFLNLRLSGILESKVFSKTRLDDKLQFMHSDQDQLIQQHSVIINEQRAQKSMIKHSHPKTVVKGTKRKSQEEKEAYLIQKYDLI